MDQHDQQTQNDTEEPLLSGTSESSSGGFLTLGFSRAQSTRRIIWKIVVVSFLVVLIVTVITALIVTARRNNSVLQESNPKVVMVLSDGLRYDLFNVSMPSLTALGENGVRAEYMISQYPTVSAVNMYSIATGLYPESHGVVGNSAFNLNYHNQTGGYLETLNVTYWWDEPGVEPLWVTARKQGLKTGTLMYPGGDVAIKGVRPNENIASSRWSWKHFDFETRVDITMRWLLEGDHDLIYLYLDEPDESLHKYGIGSKEVVDKIKEVDEAIGYLQKRIKEEDLEDIVNIIVVSDHGHATVTKKINIFESVDEEDFDFYLKEDSPKVLMQPKADKLMEVFGKLQNVSEHLTPYLKKDIPDRFHYKNNDRILSLLLKSDLGVVIGSSPGKGNPPKSSHGWDPSYPEMHSIFYAKGPAFKDDYVAKSFQNVDVYPLMCKLLGITPRPNNGSLDEVNQMLKVTTEMGDKMALLN
ncbi:ectonucleotide pyrophosphatase/phosphodiesterase family member 7-like [Glandiceps talaboti]